MPLLIVRNDITKMQVDAIVNAANENLLMGGGVCGAIFTAAGADQLQQECGRIGHCDTGNAVITGGYRLPAKYIIHTVGPVWRGGLYDEEAKLRACYEHSLKLAKSKGLASIAFPLISSGIYGYPKDRAISVAVSQIGAFLQENDIDVFLTVFGAESCRLSERLEKSISVFIGEQSMLPQKALPSLRSDRRIRLSSGTTASVRAAPAVCSAELERAVDRADEPFSKLLLRLIDERKLSYPQVCQGANLDRRLFSKIRSNSQYRPSKNTVLALAIALRLNLDQTEDLLVRAGYELSSESKFDLIIAYFIQEGIFNVYEINVALFAFDESLLGA